MKNTSTHIDYIELPVANSTDLAHSQQFFSQVFGWTYTAWGDDYADTNASGIGSGLNADAAHRSTCPLPVIHVPDLDAALQAVLEAGGVLTRDVFAFPGGRRFHFREPGGNELAAWSEQQS